MLTVKLQNMYTKNIYYKGKPNQNKIHVRQKEI